MTIEKLLSKLTCGLLALLFVVTSGPLQIALAQPSPPAETPPAVVPHPDTQNKVSTGRRKVNLITPKVAFDANSTDADIFDARVFQEPLVPTSKKATPGENSALAKALTAFKTKKSLEDVSDLTNFIKAYPTSRWLPSMQLCLAQLRFESGYITEALALWQSSWEGAKNEKGQMQKAIADRAVAQLLLLNAKLGRADEVSHYLIETKGRNFHGSDEETIGAAKQGLACMRERSGDAFKCGPYALNSILYIGKTTQGRHLLLDKYKSSKIGLQYQMAKRSKGASMITPAIMHWSADHYAAILREYKGRYQIKDPTFSFSSNMWLSQKAIDDQTDGYYLVPVGPLPAGWSTVSVEEGKSVWGKGDSISCNNSMGPGQPQTCPGAKCKPKPKPQGGGGDGGCPMAQALLWTMQCNLNIFDTPLSYAPQIGPQMDFMANFNYNEINQPPIFSFSNLTNNWSFSWLSYLTLDPSQNATVRTRGGGSELYNYSAPDNVSNPYPPSLTSQATLTIVGNTSSALGYEYHRNLPDGTVEIYSQTDGSSPPKIFLTEVVDPHGNSATIQYNSSYIGKITTITDALGQQTTVNHVQNTNSTLPSFYQISSIQDPFTGFSPRRMCSFAYDSTNTYLTSITDELGLKSSFAYDSGSFIQAMTTPYGPTTFYKYQPPGSVTGSSGLRFTFPDGTSTVSETWLGEVNQSYYWDREAIALYPTDPGSQIHTHCQTTEWLLEGSMGPYVLGPVPHSIKPPLDNATVFTYPGQSYNGIHYFEGTTNKPSQVARTIGSGNNPQIQTWNYQYNPFGRITQSIDPLGRTFNYFYAGNNIDLLEVRESKGTDNFLLGKWVYNNQHEPLVKIDGSGQRTVYTYNANGTIATKTDQNNSIWTYSYDSSKRLTTITGPLSSLETTTITYDSVATYRVATVTNSEGYKISFIESTPVPFTYDYAARPTFIGYPDGSTVQFAYSNLDAILFKDRIGRYTTRVYNNMDQLVSVTDPLSRTTQFTWCNCGSLSTLTDANNHTTSWNHDLQGRVIQKQYPPISGASETYNYEYDSVGRLSSRSDAMSTPQITNYNYNLDNTLAQILYQNPVNPTPNVIFNYDQNFMRLSSVANTWTGTNPYGIAQNYSYGAYVTNPFAIATATFGGTPASGQSVHIGVQNSLFAPAINYTVPGSISLSTLATNIANSITADSGFQFAGITATASGPTVTLNAPAEIGITTGGVFATSGLTATILMAASMTVSGTPIAGDKINLTFRNPGLSGNAYSLQYTVGSLAADTNASMLASSLATTINNATSTLGAAGIVANANGNYITFPPPTAGTLTLQSSTNGVVAETIGGNPAASDIYNITVYDAGLTGGQITESYSGSTNPNTIASNLASQITSACTAAGITASSNGSLVSINSTSTNPTVYAQFVTNPSGTPSGTITNSAGPTEVIATTSESGTFGSTAVTGQTGAGAVSTVTNSAITSSAINYAFDVLGRTVYRSINGPSNETTWFPDAISRPRGEIDTLGSFGYTWKDDTLGSSKGTWMLSNVAYANPGLASAISWNTTPNDELITEIQNTNPSTSTTFSDFQYQYDSAQEITQWILQQPGGTTKTFTPSYDYGGQLTGFVQNSGSQWQYQYDNNAAHAGTGNWTSKAVNGGSPTTASYNALNQLTGTTSPSSTLSYDNNGNMTSDGTNTYLWDAENRIQKISYAGSDTSIFSWDGLGRCWQIVDTVGGSVTTCQFIWSGNQRCQEIDTTSAATTTKQFFTWGENITISSPSSNKNYYFMKDHLGSVRELVDSTGAVVAEYAYSPFGEVTKLSGSVDSDFQYAGYYVHPRSGLLLTATRAYMPSIGRFINRDPIQESGGTNLYGYVGNNPVSFSDPSGTYFVFSRVTATGETGATGQDLRDFNSALKYLSGDPGMDDLINDLRTSDNPVHIKFNCNKNTNQDPATDTINWDPNARLLLFDPSGALNGQSISPALALGHELGHQEIQQTNSPDFLNYLKQRDPSLLAPMGTFLETLDLNQFERPAAQNLGEPVRDNYWGRFTH